jgi:hypothetical protein
MSAALRRVKKSKPTKYYRVLFVRRMVGFIFGLTAPARKRASYLVWLGWSGWLQESVGRTAKPL